MRDVSNARRRQLIVIDEPGVREPHLIYATDYRKKCKYCTNKMFQGCRWTGLFCKERYVARIRVGFVPTAGRAHRRMLGTNVCNGGSDVTRARCGDKALSNRVSLVVMFTRDDG